MNRERFELTELGLNIRHWENLRWISMTVFMAIMGGLGAAILGAGGVQIPKSFTTISKYAGLLLTVIFWVQDERIVAYWRNYRERAKTIEASIGYQIFSTSPKRGLVSAGVAVRALYVSFAGAWTLLIFT